MRDFRVHVCNGTARKVCKRSPCDEHDDCFHLRAWCGRGGAENLIEEGPGRYSNHPHTRKLHERHNWSGGGPKPAHKRYGNICRSASAPGCQLRGERFRARANRCCGAGPATVKIMRNFSIAPLKQKWTHRPALVVRLRTGTLSDRVSPPSFHYFFTPPSTVRHSPLRPVRKM